MTKSNEKSTLNTTNKHLLRKEFIFYTSIYFLASVFQVGVYTDNVSTQTSGTHFKLTYRLNPCRQTSPREVRLVGGTTICTDTETCPACENNAQCIINADTCVSGKCMCGENTICQGNTDTCTG